MKTPEIQLNFDDANQTILMFCAFRYALGGRSYATSAICEILKANAKNMGEITKAKYRKEINEALENSRAGGKYEVEEWLNVLGALERDE